MQLMNHLIVTMFVRTYIQQRGDISTMLLKYVRLVTLTMPIPMRSQRLFELLVRLAVPKYEMLFSGFRCNVLRLHVSNNITQVTQYTGQHNDLSPVIALTQACHGKLA